MKRTLFALALMAALPLSAQASELKYNYIEGGYARTTVAGFDFNGYDLKGSAAFGDDFFGTASYTHGSKNGADINEGTVGLGYRIPVSDKANFDVGVSYVHDSVPGLSDNGYKVSAGFRGLMSDVVEGNINVNYADVGDFGNGIGAGAGLVFHVNDTWGITTGYDYAKRDSLHFNTWNLGARASF